MYKLVVVLLLLIGTMQIVHGQFTIRSISLHKNPSSTWLSYRFPLVKGTNKTAARNINSILQNEILENKGTISDSDKIFEESRYINNDSVHQSGYSDLSVSIKSASKDESFV